MSQYAKGPTPPNDPIDDVYWATCINTPPAGATWQRDRDDPHPVYGTQSMVAFEEPYFDPQHKVFRVKKIPFRLTVTGALEFEYSQNPLEPFPGNSGYAGSGGVPTIVEGVNAVGTIPLPGDNPIGIAGFSFSNAAVERLQSGAGVLFIRPRSSANQDITASKGGGDNGGVLITAGLDRQGLCRVPRVDPGGYTQTARPPYDFQSAAASVSGAASPLISLGAVGNVQHSVDSITAVLSGNAGIAAPAQILVQITDAAAGAGVSIWQAWLSIPNQPGAVDRISLSGLGIAPPVGNGLSAFFNAVTPVGTSLSLTIGGYDQ